MASGGRHGLAQSMFQVGGNVGSAIGPLLAAFIVVPHGQRSIAWFSLVALLAMVVLWNVGALVSRIIGISPGQGAPRSMREHAGPAHRAARSRLAIAILLALIFSKYFYLASLTSYYTFYLISKFGVSVQTAQLHLFVFLGAVAAGTIVGGPIGDRFGRKYVIWVSILGVLPFTLLLPHANLFWTGVLTVVIGLILASAFSAIVVYAQELVPGQGRHRSPACSSASPSAWAASAPRVLGELADMTSIDFVYQVCAFLPAIGLLAAFLPNLDGARRRRRQAA